MRKLTIAKAMLVGVGRYGPTLKPIEIVEVFPHNNKVQYREGINHFSFANMDKCKRLVYLTKPIR
jgi:hypothetical protein